MLGRGPYKASTTLSLTGCLCFKALSLALCLPLPPSLLSGANPPDSTTSSLCPPNPAGLLGRLSSLYLLSHSKITPSYLALGASRSWQHTICTVTLLPPLNRSLPLHLSFTCSFTSHLSFSLSAQNAMPVFFLLQHSSCNFFPPLKDFVFWTLKLIEFLVFFVMPYACPAFFSHSFHLLSSFVPSGNAGGQRWCHGGQDELRWKQDHPPVQHPAPQNWGRGTNKPVCLCVSECVYMWVCLWSCMPSQLIRSSTETTHVTSVSDVLTELVYFYLKSNTSCLHLPPRIPEY